MKEEQRQPGPLGQVIPSEFNARAVEGYEGCAEEYASTTGPDHRALGELVKGLTRNAQVLEIGSGPGWDADWLDAWGAIVRRTDAAQSFVDLQNARGKHAERLDVLRDEFGGPYDAIVALYVLQHVDRPALPQVFQKVAAALKDGGSLLFSIREGQGELVTHGSSGATYYVALWELPELTALLAPLGLNLLWSTAIEGTEGRWLIALFRRGVGA